MHILEIVHPRRLACLLAAVVLTVPAIPSAIAGETGARPLAVEQLHSELARLKRRVGLLEAKLVGDRTADRMVIGLTKITSKDGALGEDGAWAERYWQDQAGDGN